MAKPRVVNRRERTTTRPPEGTVYVGRPSKWGNPFRIDNYLDFEQRRVAIEKYEIWIKRQPHLMADLHELRGKNLECWCAPRPCHAEVLLRLANKPIPRTRRKD